MIIALFERVPPGVLVLLSTGLFVLCDTLAGAWGKSGRNSTLLLMLALAPLGVFFFGLLNQSRSFASVSGMVNVSIVAANVLISLLVFKEILAVRGWIGLACAMLAIILLSGEQ